MRRLSLSLWIGLAALSPSLYAQEVSGVQVLSISAAGEEMSEEMRERLAEGAASFSIGGPAGGMAFSTSPLGGVDPNSRSQLFGLLSNESVRTELRLTDEQYAGVKEIMKKSQQRFSELVRARMKESTQEGGRSAIRIGGGDFQEIRAENEAVAEEAIEEILLPEQMKRIRQLAYQVRIAQTGIGDALVEGQLGEEIGVHDDQKQNLIDRATKIEAEARQAILEIKAAARAKLFKELTPDQRKAAEELLGDYFEYEEKTLSQQLHQSMKRARERSAESRAESKED